MEENRFTRLNHRELELSEIRAGWVARDCRQGITGPAGNQTPDVELGLLYKIVAYKIHYAIPQNVTKLASSRWNVAGITD
jgi:hypothetical protein